MAAERLVIVEDEKLIRWSLRSRLADEGYQIVEAETAKRAFALLEEEECDLMLLDYRLPDLSGLEVLERLRHDHPEIAVIMMTAYGTVDTAVQAMKLGAFDFLTKPVNMDELVLIVEKALETTRLRREVRDLRRQQRAVLGQVRIIGKSEAIRNVLELVGKVSRSQASTVLIEGESGTGKDLVAKAIHTSGSRADRAFVNITCSALAETLLESELFGHERGAFTDARVQKKGLLELANGGTAFLDEIGEMGPGMQAKLLRFLEEKTFKRVGGTRDIRVDVRIVAATNANLERAVEDGRFRADLFYRLQVIPIMLPPLRARREDIPLLVQHFLDHYNRELRRETREIDPVAMQLLAGYDWPGNIRELRNVIERVLILEDKGRIDVGDLPAAMRSRTAGAALDRPSPVPVASLNLEDLELAAIRQALDRTGANQVQAAKLLGVSRDTLRYRMKKFGLR